MIFPADVNTDTANSMEYRILAYRKKTFPETSKLLSGYRSPILKMLKSVEKSAYLLAEITRYIYYMNTILYSLPEQLFSNC